MVGGNPDHAARFHRVNWANDDDDDDDIDDDEEKSAPIEGARMRKKRRRKSEENGKVVFPSHRHLYRVDLILHHFSCFLLYFVDQSD